LGPAAGMPLALLLEGAKEVLREAGAGAGAGAVVDAEPMRDTLDDFFCSEDGGWLGRDKDDMDGFLRSCSVEAGERSWDWLPEDLRTGRREDAGLGIPDGRGMAEGWSMVIREVNAVSMSGSLNGQQCVSPTVQTPDACRLEIRNSKLEQGSFLAIK